MADIKVNELPTSTPALTDKIFGIGASQEYQAEISGVANVVLKNYSNSSLETTSKNVVGAINELNDTTNRLEQTTNEILTGANEIISEATNNWLDKNVTPTGSAVVVDSSLKVNGAAADSKTVGDKFDTIDETLTDAVNDLKSDLESIDTGLSSEAKTALLACFQNVAWVVANGQEYYDALADALNDETPTPPPLPLPSGYQRIAYIANPGGSGTGAVIDTQAVFPLNFTAKLKLYASAAPSGNLSGVIAGYSGTGVNVKYFAICAVAPNASTIGAFSGTNRTFVELSNLYGNDASYEIKVNGTNGTFTVTASNSYGRQSASGTLADTDYLGGIIRAFYYGSFQNQFIGRMASFELTNDDTNAVVTNLVACKRTSDGVGGMYDLQNSVFYSSNTTVAFVKGGDI